MKERKRKTCIRYSRSRLTDVEKIDSALPDREYEDHRRRAGSRHIKASPSLSYGTNLWSSPLPPSPSSAVSTTWPPSRESRRRRRRLLRRRPG